MSKDRYIEHSFPIVQLNPLSVHERNAFKPIYKMHKWFARRSSSIFRAILLAAALPHENDEGKPIDLMKEFYTGHADDLRMRRPDGSRLRVLDPFMGGGTTIVEALRLGFDVTGVDYNPIAWFIVKGETTPVDLGELEAAYNRVADKVKDELLDLYKTKCPVTGKDADIIYGFWVKQGICVDPECRAKTDLFKDYVVGRVQGDLGVRHYPGVECPDCNHVFDWELEKCSITAGAPQISTGGKGETRTFAYGAFDEGVSCPQCKLRIRGQDLRVGAKIKKKKVTVRALVDPSTGAFFEVRGAIPKRVKAPGSGFQFGPMDGAVNKGKFTCIACGRRQSIVESARAYGDPLPFRYYGIYGYTPHYKESMKESDMRGLVANGGKWFAPVSDADLRRVVDCDVSVGSDGFFTPHQEIHDGYNTNRLIIHQYRRWRDLFGSRQLAALGSLLAAIAAESRSDVRNALLGAFQSHLDNVSVLTSYDVTRNMLTRVSAGHDYRNPTTIAENNVWGVASLGRGTFSNSYQKYVAGLRYGASPELLTQDKKSLRVNDVLSRDWSPSLMCHSALDLSFYGNESFDLIITDPPYAGSVQYAEMSDWSYVWIWKILRGEHPEFEPEVTLKSQEIIENGADKDPAFFFTELTKVWKECHRVLVDDGLLVFTFHHAEGDRWTGLLTSLFEAGFYLVAAYPTHSEALNSIVIQATKGITYDIIHVCRKRLIEPEPIPWTRLRREVRKQAREQLTEIEQGKDVLPGPDVQMILIGRALMLFSRHYGKVLDGDGKPMDLDEAMERILLLVREVRGEELPLPGKLQNIDSLTQIFLLHVVGKEGWTRDDLHKELRGYKHGPKELVDAGLVRPVQGDKGRLEPVPPLERLSKERLSKQLGGPLVDKLHLILGTIDEGHAIAPLMDAWRGQWEPITEALTWISKSDPALRESTDLARRQIESLGPEGATKKAGQIALPLPGEEA